MNVPVGVSANQQNRALWGSTLAFAASFAVWTIFCIIGTEIKREFGLSQTQFGLLLGAPILSGSLVRVVLGIWTDQYGGRRVFPLVMLAGAAATYLLSYADNYPEVLIAALGVGVAGGAFAVGVSYVARWHTQTGQGSALSVFGSGNIGVGLTQVAAPFALIAYGWQGAAQIWAAALAVIAIVFLLMTAEDPIIQDRWRRGEKAPSFWLELEPLKNIQVWRFSLYYFFLFGGFVAIALWLPYYFMNVYNLDIKAAGMAAAMFSIPASLFHAYGGRLTDRYGARTVVYWAFLVAVLCAFILSYPPTIYIVRGVKEPVVFELELGTFGFTVAVFVLGFFLALGKIAILKHIPIYYPKYVGAVAGLVGMVGGLGGFVLPIAFGALVDLTGIWTSGFMLLFVLFAGALTWMHLAIRQMERGAVAGTLEALPQLPEMLEIHGPEQAGALAPKVLTDWRPEDKEFWETSGRAVARRNLWLSIPSLLLSFAIWQVWSVVVAKLPLVGFKFTTDQLFWLAALPGISGATLRVFYSFMVPIFGGRLWTTLATWSLMIPAIGIGYAVQNPQTPYAVLLILALFCGLGGGNFASSMANISFFFPKREKGNALALNAGLGNLGVSVVQFLTPIVITTGVFGWLGGEPAMIGEGTHQSPLWLQNAGFIWAPFIAASAFAAWFGMNDIASAKASFAQQAIIFKRRHNWIMCWLYTGTFGSFIGYAAGFPLLTKILFPDVDVLQIAFLGPLVGALSRSATGWIADKWGGARVTLWVFLIMMVGVSGVLYFVGIKDQPHAFYGFFAMFLLLFLATGVGNASTFQMIPAIMRKEMSRLMPDADATARTIEAEKESAAITGFTSAVAAFGAFFIPKAYGTSIAATGGPQAALFGFLAFYVTCLVITWFVYARKGGLLYDVERRSPQPIPQTAQ